jgi:hypothetical protein
VRVEPGDESPLEDPAEHAPDREEEGENRAPVHARVDTVLQEPLRPPSTVADDKRLKHDPREVRRLIAMAFSAGELSRYAERWRVFTDREGSVQDGARALVRALEGRDKMAQLVESLQAHKPLIEWPEPTIECDEPPPAPAAEPTPVASEPVAPAAIVDPYPEVTARDRDDGAVRIPKLWLLAGAALVLLVGSGIAAAMLLPGDDSESSGRINLASDAAEELDRSVRAVREACDVQPDDDSARGQLAASFRRCSVPTIRPSRVDVPLPVRKADAPGPRRPVLTKRPPAPISRSGACLNSCHDVHNQCKTSQCGSEPSSAQDYENYQRCLGTCLGQYSRCRLACR